MKVDYHPHISLADTRKIIQSTRKHFEFDLGVFSLANLQHLLSDYLISKGILNTDVLIRRMKEYPDSFEDLLHWLDVPDSEMFRNPDAWTLLQKKLLPLLLSEKKMPKIWFPSCSNAEELFSLVILAIEEKIRDKIELLASSMSHQRLMEAGRGLFSSNSVEHSSENYIRSGGKCKLEDYIERIDSVIVRKINVRENITFSSQGNMPDVRNDLVDLVIYKNKLIYYTPEARFRVLKNLISSIRTGGYLMLGYKEVIKNEDLLSRVRLIYEEEKIYQVF